MDSSETKHDAPFVATEKVRILLETTTHLMPGNDRFEKITFVKNLISQHHWQRDFDKDQERWYAYKDYFGLDDRRCFFLTDYFGYDHDTPAEAVSVIWYKWGGGGDPLVRNNCDLHSKIARKLGKWPFTWAGRPRYKVPKGPDGEYPPLEIRSMIESSLYLGIPLYPPDIEFLQTYPEHVKWLKNRLDPRLWAKIESFCNLSMVTEGDKS